MAVRRIAPWIVLSAAFGPLVRGSFAARVRMRVGSRVRILALLPPASSAVDEPLGGRLLPVEDDAPSAEQHQPEGALAQIQAEKLDEVGAIMRLPEARDDGPLSMRLGYMAPETICSFSDAIRASSSQGRLGVAVDLKRSTVDASGVVMELRDPSSDLNAEASYLLSIGVDALIVSCGATRYGSSLSDLDMLAQVLRGQPTPGARPIAPPLLAKDFVVHPIQIAQMLEAGASAVLLVCGLVGPDLEQLLNSCTLMGVEALVEVHTPDEVLFAVECGATAILVNRRCRATGAFDAARPIQLGALIPGHVLSLATGGYCTHADGQTIDCRELEALLEAGYDGVIVGRALNSQAGPGESARRAQLVLAEIKRHQLEQRAVSWGSNLIL